MILMAYLHHRVRCCLITGIIGLVIHLYLMTLVVMTTSKQDLSSTSNEVRHLAFVKVHKASSSTVTNIFYRFGYERNLVFVLPHKGNYLGKGPSGIIGSTILPPPLNKTYDILCNHCIFNETSFDRFLPNDTMYIGIVREPFKRIQSAYHYYRNVFLVDYLKKNSGFEQFLYNQMYFEPRSPYLSRTNNRMAIDFGFPAIDFHNITKFKKYLKRLDSKFCLVMVTEYFDESVVLLRRMLNWQIKDILYITKNTLMYNKTTITDNLLEKVRNFTHLDYLLYDFFLVKLLEKLKQQPEDFFKEVACFKEIRIQVEKFCRSGHVHKTNLYINKTISTPSLTISPRECDLLETEELVFLEVIRHKHTMLLQRDGANTAFSKSYNPYLKRNMN